MSREDAYAAVQRAAMATWTALGEPEGKDFRSNLLADPAVAAKLAPEALDRAMDPQRDVRHVDTIFRRGVSAGEARAGGTFGYRNRCRHGAAPGKRVTASKGLPDCSDASAENLEGRCPSKPPQQRLKAFATSIWRRAPLADSGGTRSCARSAPGGLWHSFAGPCAKRTAVQDARHPGGVGLGGAKPSNLHPPESLPSRRPPAPPFLG